MEAFHRLDDEEKGQAFAATGKLPLLDRLADNTVQGLDSVGRVDSLPDVLRVAEQCVRIGPVV